MSKLKELIEEIEYAIDKWKEERPDDEQGTTQDWNRFAKVEKRLDDAIADAKKYAEDEENKMKEET